MKKLFCLLYFLLTVSALCLAQLTPEQRIQDSVIGWWSNNKFDRLKPPTDAIGKKKEASVNKMLEWMKKTYTPVAGLGTSSRYINKAGFGVQFLVWNVSHDKEWTEPNGNFKPIPEENTPFWIAANRTFGSYAIPLFKKENEYYFTMQPDGYNAADRTNGDPRIHSNAYNYLTWVNEWQTVYLTPGNKLPFLAITKAELLQRAEESLDKLLENEIKDVQAKWPDNKQSQEEAIIIRKKTIDKYRSNIQKLRERHQSSLNEPAIIRDMQPTMYSFELDPDIFKIDNYEKGLKHYYQVYKVDADLYAKMQSDTPQWIAVAFPYNTKESGNQLYEMYKALSQNFNYDYVYNYFFNAEKVKGTEYAPANEASLKARLQAYRNKGTYDNSNVASAVTLPAGVHYLEDFSKDAEGNEPAGWYYYEAGSEPHIVTSIKDQKGKWLKPGYGRSITPKFLKLLPANFKLECDVATDGNFSSRTGGALQIELTNRNLLTNNDVTGAGKDATTADIKIRVDSGNEDDYNNNNYRGIIRVDISNSPEPNEENFTKGIRAEYPLKEFTNKKNKVHITLEVKNGSISVFVNDKLAIKSNDFKLPYGGTCKRCGVPADLRFSSILFNNVTNDSDNMGAYIGNIKISAN